jgi:hypothetical protein
MRGLKVRGACFRAQGRIVEQPASYIQTGTNRIRSAQFPHRIRQSLSTVFCACLCSLHGAKSFMNEQVNEQPKPEATKDIQEILRKRREMLTRVRQDLDRVNELQEDFWKGEQKREDGGGNGKSV